MFYLNNIPFPSPGANYTLPPNDIFTKTKTDVILLYQYLCFSCSVINHLFNDTFLHLAFIQKSLYTYHNSETLSSQSYLSKSSFYHYQFYLKKCFSVDALDELLNRSKRKWFLKFKAKVFRKKSLADAQSFKTPHFYIKTGHSENVIVQCGPFICRSEYNLNCFYKTHFNRMNITKIYVHLVINFYLLSKIVNYASDKYVDYSE